MTESSPLIECIPNFSIGDDPTKIAAIRRAIAEVRSVRVLHVDAGIAANRTVITFAGPPEAVVEAAYRGIAIAAQVIDMRTQRGEHPRIGATDVCPLVPVRAISTEEVNQFAHQLAARVGEELHIPVYCYEHSATRPERRLLADIRSGEYEGLAQKMTDPDWQPDYGPARFNARSGATVIGARPFLIAYNVNLRTTDAGIATDIARDVRETGRLVRRADGSRQRVPGTCPGLRGIGWYIEEYGCAQVSLNVTDMDKTSVHRAFEEVKRAARQRGIDVTGSELIGLAPLRVFLEAGRFYAETNLPEQELIEMAIDKLGLNDLQAFDPQQRILEYLLHKGKG